jgi:preprotein translocase subunit SecF
MPVSKSFFTSIAHADSLPPRRAFNFVGMGKSVILLALLLIVVAAWHVRAQGLSLDGGHGIYVAVAAWLSFSLYCSLRCARALALAAALPLLLDLLVVMALLALLEHPLDLGCALALVVVLGYSLLGKVLLLRRISRNLRNARSARPLSLSALANISIHQALASARHVLLMLALVVLSLCLLAAGSLHTPALVMALGLLAGTASTVFVTSAIWLTLQQGLERTVVPTRYRAALTGKVFLLTVLMLAVLGVGSWF